MNEPKERRQNRDSLVVAASWLCPWISEGALLPPREYSGKVIGNRTFQNKSFQSRSSSHPSGNSRGPLDPFGVVCEVMTVYIITPRCYLPSPCPFSWVHREFPNIHWRSRHYSVDQCFPDDWHMRVTELFEGPDRAIGFNVTMKVFFFLM